MFYDLMATTGSIFAACEAGIIPAITPTAIQMNTVDTSMGTDMNTGKFNGPDKINVNI